MNRFASHGVRGGGSAPRAAGMGGAMGWSVPVYASFVSHGFNASSYGATVASPVAFVLPQAIISGRNRS